MGDGGRPDSPAWPVRPFARTLGGTFVFGGLLGGAWLAFPAHEHRNYLGIAVLAVLAVLAVVFGAALLSRRAERAPVGLPLLMLTVGQVEIALATWFSRDVRTGIVAFFLWIPAISFRYLGPRQAWTQFAITMVLLAGLVVAGRSPPDAAERDAGVSIALDDFGKGYSWLGHLGRLPLDVLKLDRSLVADITRDSRAATIVGTVLAMGEALGLGVVAEGVETSDQRDLLLALGCEYGQGWLFGRPGPELTSETVPTAGPG